MTDFADRFDVATERLTDWIGEERLVWAEDIVDGDVTDASRP